MAKPARVTLRNWCPGAESNHRHGDFQDSGVGGQGLIFPRKGIAVAGALPAGCRASVAHDHEASGAPELRSKWDFSDGCERIRLAEC